MTRMKDKCTGTLKLYATLQLDKVSHVLNFFNKHELRDHYNNPDVPLLINAMSLLTDGIDALVSTTFTGHNFNKSLVVLTCKNSPFFK